MKRRVGLSEDAIAKKRDDALRRALNTPPKQNAELKGKSLRSLSAINEPGHGMKRRPKKP